jgi:methionyl-tRNA formyltransferase
MSNAHSRPRFRCLFFGMPCAFSSPILAALARPDIELVGVVTPQLSPDTEPFRVIRGLSTRPVISLSSHARQFQAPRYLVRDIRNERLQVELANLAPDLIVVACFPRLIPDTVTAMVRIAAFNIHPSLLPRHRGPDPLFWTFRAGESTSGVTVHSLSNEFDAGGILAQTATTIADDESLATLEQRLAQIGAELLAQLIAGLPSLPPALPQDESVARSEPAPCSADREIDANWTVAHARRFIAGVGRSHGPLAYRGLDRALPVIGLATDDRGVEIRLRDGLLRVTTGNPADA